jgi:mono/diheme cytochrome c family protein
VLLALSSNQKLGLALAGAAFVAFALVCAMLIPRYRPSFPAGHMGWFIAACVLFTVGMMLTIGFVAKESEHEAGAETQATETEPAEPAPAEPQPPAPTETSAAGGSDPVGKVIFTTNCASCHTLADAGTTGNVGPNLDQAKPDEALVVERVTNGQGVMPSFKGVLTEEQINEVAAYVSAAAGT